MEFELIRQYFEVPFAPLAQAHRQVVGQGIGDDCAQLCVPEGHTLFVSSDSSVEGVHFFSDDAPFDVAAKALASNLSDLAACGAQPMGFSLNLTLAKPQPAWLQGFSSGLLHMATGHACPLIGGDTTHGPCNMVSITVYGCAPLSHHGFHRSRAKAGQDLWVSGLPGLARLGMWMAYRQRGLLNKLCESPGEADQLDERLGSMPVSLSHLALQAFNRPEPRVALGLALRPYASACLDLSDGLAGDLLHIAQLSGVAIELQAQPLLACWSSTLGQVSSQHADWLLDTSLSGGDDYELCFTASVDHRQAIEDLARQAEPSLFRVGRVLSGQGIWLTHGDGQALPVSKASFEHFRPRGTTSLPS